MDLNSLLKDNEKEINNLKDRLKDVLVPEICDNVWLLRFVLSYKNAVNAESACRFTIKWHKDNEEGLRRLRAGIPELNSHLIEQFKAVGEHKFTHNGEPMFYVRLGICNIRGLMDNIAYADVLKDMIYARIKMLDYCDAMTKKQGRLIKVITVLDFQGISISKANDYRFAMVIGEASKLSEKLFPQLLGLNIVINIPPYLFWAINVVKPLLSKRAVAKMKICPGKFSNKPISTCPFIRNQMGGHLDDIPTFLGGKCNCPGGCIGGHPNAQTSAIDDVGSDGIPSINVPARTRQVFDLPLRSGDIVTYHIRVKDRNFELECTFRPDHPLSAPLLSIIPKRLVNAHEGAIHSTWKADTPGVLVFTFDNTKSYFRSKTIQFKFDVNVRSTPIDEKAPLSGPPSPV